jgi:hypothetical protein
LGKGLRPDGTGWRPNFEERVEAGYRIETGWRKYGGRIETGKRQHGDRMEKDLRQFEDRLGQVGDILET